MADLPPLYAVLAEFAEPQALVDATRRLRAQGFTRVDAFTPFPVDGLAEALGFSERRVPLATLVGGIVGAVAGFLMQVGTNLDFPLWIGGRPLVAVPAFMLIVFELMVLFAVLGGIGTMLISNRLPRLHHPLFDAERFHLASSDRFFLAVLAGPGFDPAAARTALARLNPTSLTDVPDGDRR